MTTSVVLAYSGGLDTSVAVRWLNEEGDVDVHCLAVDVGQADLATPDAQEAVVARAKAAGAASCEVVDAKAQLAEACLLALAANARYEGAYPLVSALSRPVISECLVAAAHTHGATAVAHGCTAKGNDQVRFEVSVRALAPDLDVLTPARSWGLTRPDAVAYAQKWAIPIEATAEKLYSIDENLWGRAIECGAIEDPWAAPPDEPYTLTEVRETTGATCTIGFESGRPVALDGTALEPAELIARLNELAGARGVGRYDLVESRRVGIKSREVYECPAAHVLLLAHEDLERLTLERDVLHEKQRLESRWAELVYDGMWHAPLKAALDAFFSATQTYVTGEVRVRVEPPGLAVVEGRRSPYALYDLGLATYEHGDTFRHQDAEGFVRLWGRGVQTWAERQRGRGS